MTTFVLLPGAGGSAWTWHLVAQQLRGRGNEVVAVDLPCDDDSAGLADYAAAAVVAVGDRHDVVVVAHSFAGLTAPLLCDLTDVKRIVLVAAMVPSPGESPGDWWANTGWPEARRVEVARHGGDDSPQTTFTHDLSPALAEAVGQRLLAQSGTPFEKPWPLAVWPDVATQFVLCRGDRFFPADFLRRVVHDRLGLVPDEIDSGHLPMLAHPEKLVDVLVSYDDGL